MESIEHHKPTAVVTNVVVRRAVWTLIKGQHYLLPVLSYNELLPTLDVAISDQVSAESSPRLAEVAQ